MFGPSRRGAERRGLATALVVSALFHAFAALVVAGVWLLAHRPAPPPGPRLDTRAEPDLTLDLTFRDVAFEPADARPPAPADPPPAPEPPARRPEVVPVPSVLPAAMLAVIRRPSPPPADVVEVPFALPMTRAAPQAPRPDPPLTPAAAVTDPAPPATPPGSPAASPAAPLHGGLDPRQAIVYVLDASGSMGRAGKFARAREALLATLRAQPETVRFQVVVYAGVAKTLLPAPDGGCVPVTPGAVAAAGRALLAVEPAGRSSHLDGLRAALGCRPDLVLFLTDADDLPAPLFHRLVAAVPRPTTVCVARVPESGAPEVVPLP